jgi:hypothetical protein
MNDPIKCVRKCVSVSDAKPKISSSNDKTRLAYWRRRIFKPLYRQDGQKLHGPNFCVEIQHTEILHNLIGEGGKAKTKTKRVRWSLGPGEREAAAARARAIYLHLIANGWDSTITRFKPESTPEPDPSIGAFIAAASRVADLQPKTLRAYASALRKIASDIAGLSPHYGSGKRRAKWLERVHAQRLSLLSSANVQKWKRDFLSRAGQDPLKQRSRRVSANTYLRLAKSLFSPAIIKQLDLELPDPLPFANVQFEPKQNTKYRSDFDIVTVIAAAREELALAAPELFKIFCLACFAGLRRREIDLLPWSAFRWDQGVLRIETTTHFGAKTEDSLGDIPLDGQVLELFRGYLARTQSAPQFVIESAEPPRPELSYAYYRCEAHFRRLTGWLRAHGVRSRKPLHTLRKEYGSQICSLAGIYAASRALRHANIAVTAAHYTDARAKVTTGLGHLLSSPKIVEFEEVA